VAVTVRTTLEIAATETATADAGTPTLRHVLPLGGFGAPAFVVDGDGTGDDQQDAVYSDTLELAAATQALDLAGTLTSKLTGAVVTFAKIRGLAVVNRSAADAVTIGGGATPVFGAQAPIGPGGAYLHKDPIDGIAVAAGVSDLLLFDPGAATFSVDVLIWGTSG